MNVYSSCNINDKIEMWDEIIKIKLAKDCKQWCILGDFNDVRKPNERKGDKLRG